MTTKDAVFVTITEEIWLKAKHIINWIKEACHCGIEVIDVKTQESYRCFLIYVCHTYPTINPYLKGVYLSLDSWRPWHSEDAWKLSMAEIRATKLKEGYDPASVNI